MSQSFKLFLDLYLKKNKQTPCFCYVYYTNLYYPNKFTSFFLNPDIR